MLASGNSVVKAGFYVPLFFCAPHFFPPIVLAQQLLDQGTDPNETETPGRNWLASGLGFQGSYTT